MVCKRCGKEMPDRAIYCSVCGCRLEWRNLSEQHGNKVFDADVNKEKKRHWIRRFVVGMMLSVVILLAFIIAGFNEKPGSVNTILNTVTIGGHSANRHNKNSYMPQSILSASIDEGVSKIHTLTESQIEMLTLLSKIELDEYEMTMELPKGPCIGKYVVIHNENDVAIDVSAAFDFFDSSDNKKDNTEYIEYGIAAHGIGIVLGQSEDTDIRRISYQISPSVSGYEPVSENVRMHVDDREEKGILVTVQNDSGHDIEDFRIRVLWFLDDQLETTAYRWLEKDDHHFYAGREKTVDFKRKLGKESSLVILQGKILKR